MSAAPIDYAALAKQNGAISSVPAGSVDYAALAKKNGAISSIPPKSAPAASAPPTIGFDEAHPYIAKLLDVAKSAFVDPVIPAAAKMSQEMGKEETYQTDQAFGAPALKNNLPERTAHAAASLGAGTARVAYGAGGMSPAEAALTALSFMSANPEIAGAYWATKGTGNLVGLNAEGKSSVKQAIDNPTPENVGQPFGDAAMVAGSMVGAGKIGNPLEEVAPKVAETLKNSAVDQYQKALNPTKERTKFLAQKRTPEMLDRGITTSSAADLRDTAQAKASGATKELNDVYESLPGDRKSPTAPMIQALEEWKGQFQDQVPVPPAEADAAIRANRGEAPANLVKNADGTFSRTVNLDDNAINAASAMQDTIKQYGDNITPRSMRKARQVFDESVARAGGYEGRSLADGSMLDAKKEAATAIREQLAKDNPEIAPLNAEVNFWLDVQRIAAETAKRKVGQQGGLGIQLATNAGRTAGAGLGYAVGGPAGGAAGLYLGGKLAENMAKVTTSPKWRTVSAVTKNRIADALASGNLKAAGWELQFVGRQLGVPLAAVAGGNKPTDEAQK